jgi:hypothetical protein
VRSDFGIYDVFFSLTPALSLWERVKLSHFFWDECVPGLDPA